TFSQVDEPGVINSEAGPLFTGTVKRVALLDGSPSLMRVTVPTEAEQRLDLGQQVDVYPHGSRPAPAEVPKLTAELPPASFVVAELSDERRDELFRALGLNGLTAVVQDVIDVISAAKAGAS